jgi:hypothetical protein
MPIEFRCTKCGKLLRTPDDTAGKQARCPECGTILGIPAGTPSAPPASARLGAAPAGFSPGSSAAANAPAPGAASMAANPYQSPASGSHAGAIGTGYGKLDAGDAARRAWKIFAANLGSCIAVAVLYWVVCVASMFGLMIVIFGTMMVLGGAGVGPAEMVILAVIVYCVALAVQMYFMTGQMNFFLKVSRGDRDAEVSKLFTGGRWVLPAIGGGILVAICIMLGSLLLVVPGIIVGLMLSQFLFLIIDRNAGVFEAFGESRRITSGNKAMLFVATLLPMFLIWLVLLVPGQLLPMLLPKLRFVFLGLQLLLQLLLGLFVMPWFSVLWSVCYLIMSGQRTSDQAMRGGLPMSATGAQVDA